MSPTSSLFSTTRRRRGRHLSDSTAEREVGRRLAARPVEWATSPGLQPDLDRLLGDGPVDFARVFDAVPSPCLLLSPDMVICGANQAYLRATGRTLDGLVGRFMFDAFPDNPDDPAADGVANLRASLERAVATRQPDTMPVQKYDIEVDTGDGPRFEERYWSPVNVPVLDADGQVELLIHRVEDVTGLVRHGAGRPGPEGQAELIARSAAIQSENALLRSENSSAREIAIVLQTALLPHAVRSVGSLEVATRYLPAEEGLNVCGDWYDVTDLGGGVMSVVVGDVVGHGLDAAAVMAQLRGAAAIALQLDSRPGAAMEALERRARSVDGALGAPAFIAVIDASARTLKYCTAGLVPPLLLCPDGTVVELDQARSSVLCAIDEGVARPEATLAFDPGSVLVAFTDGLVERPGEDMTVGYERLRRAMGNPCADLDQWTDAILEEALRGYVRTDDLAMVLVRYRHP